MTVNVGGMDHQPHWKQLLLSYFVQSMTHTRTVCSLYTQVLQGALGKPILILIPIYSIPFYSMLAHGREKKKIVRSYTKRCFNKFVAICIVTSVQHE